MMTMRSRGAIIAVVLFWGVQPARAKEWVMKAWGAASAEEPVLVWKNWQALTDGSQLIRAGVAKRNPELVWPLLSCMVPSGTLAIVTDHPSIGTRDVLVTSGGRKGCRGTVIMEVLAEELELEQSLSHSEPKTPAPASTRATPTPYERGLNALGEGDFDVAIAEFTTAISDDPKDTFSYIKRATAFEKKGDTASAIADYRKVLKLVDHETGAGYAAKIRNLEKTKK